MKKILMTLSTFVFLFALTGCGSKTINLNDYVEVTVSGYDGYGSASADINWSKIEEDYGNDLSFTKAAKDYAAIYDPIDLANDLTDISYEKASDLSNGDKFTYTISIKSNASDYLTCELSGTGGTYEISGLEELPDDTTEVDIEALSSGRPIDTYFLSLDTLPEGFLESLKESASIPLQDRLQEIKDFIESGEYQNKETLTIENITYKGCFLSKIGSTSSVKYKLYLLYSAEFSNSMGYGPTEVLIPMEYDRFDVDDAGDLICKNEKATTTGLYYWISTVDFTSDGDSPVMISGLYTSFDDVVNDVKLVVYDCDINSATYYDENNQKVAEY